MNINMTLLCYFYVHEGKRRSVIIWATWYWHVQQDSEPILAKKNCFLRCFCIDSANAITRFVSYLEFMVKFKKGRLDQLNLKTKQNFVRKRYSQSKSMHDFLLMKVALQFTQYVYFCIIFLKFKFFNTKKCPE